MEISIHDLHWMLKNNLDVTIIDIREKNEIDTGYIKGALFIPYEALEKKAEELIRKKENPVIVYCGFGIKSLDAVRILRKLGFEKAMSLKEGFEGWRANGYEVEGDSRLTKDQLLRYSRHILLKEIGLEGQLRLLNSKVLIVGAGGLGSPCSLYLAASGVGTIGIVDNDVVDISNLQRQIIHRTEDAGRPKVESARRTIEALNPDVKILTYRERLTKEVAKDIIKDYEIVIDGSDNFPTKYLINDICFFSQIPDVFGGVFQFEGQISIFYPHGGGPCLRCMFPKPPPPHAIPSCSEVGILGVVPGIIGTLQALETIKMLLGIGEPLIGRFLSFNALNMNTTIFKVNKNPSCELCGERATIKEPEEYVQYCEG